MNQLTSTLHDSAIFPNCRKIWVLQGEPTTDSILQVVDMNRNAIVEGKRSLQSDFVKIYMERKDPVDFFLCLTSRTAYRVEISEILESFFLCQDIYSPLQVERVITVAHEAFSNAFLWSCLGLSPDFKEEDALGFGRHIANQLKKDSFGKRLLAVEVVRDASKLKVKIYVQGKPISWDLKHIENGQDFRGTSIIKALTDDIYISPEGDQIHLIFEMREE